MIIYKLGTKWGKGTPDFYELIKNEKIALSHASECSPKRGSVVLIAKGFTNKAITTLIEDVHPVTDNDQFESLFEKYKIDYDHKTTYAKAKWIELKADEQFTYQNQDGICQIHKPEIHLITEKLITKYMQQEEISRIKKLILFKKQIILQGPPGTGKTRLAKKIARELILPKSITADDIKRLIKIGLIVKSIADKIEYTVSDIKDAAIYLRMDNGVIRSRNFNQIVDAYSNLLANKSLTGGDTYEAAIAKYMIENWDDENIYKIIQFHPSYSYEDFVRGIVAKPNPDGEGIIYEAENKSFAEFAQKALENYNLSSAINKNAVELKSNLERFISHVIEKLAEDDKFPLTENVYIFYVDDKRFKYKGDNWTAHPNGLNMNFSELKKIINSEKYSRSEIAKNEDLNALTRQHATYFTKVIERYNQLIEQNASAPVKLQSPKDFVFIIDEINRANLSSVLGELIYALEYRSKPVESMYAVDGNKELILPPNLYIIGTMNTADRSVGHIDYAIRRRFAFVDITPKDLSPELGDKFDKELFNIIANLFATNLSPEFEKKHVQLGHSYFIDKSNEGGSMEIRLKYEIKPILEEYIKDGILIGNVGEKPILEYIKSL